MITKDLGQRIKEYRNSIEMDRTYFASVEAGRRNISICNIKKIADGLGISLSEFFTQTSRRLEYIVCFLRLYTGKS